MPWSSWYGTEIPGFSSLRCSILAFHREETGDLDTEAEV